MTFAINAPDASVNVQQQLGKNAENAESGIASVIWELSLLKLVKAKLLLCSGTSV